MQVNRTEIKKLITTYARQFIVPVYQRSYDWEKEHVQKLLEDIVKSGNSSKEHFIGTIVYLVEKSNSEISQALVIDGQQRITTMFLILKALHNFALKNNILNVSGPIFESYLFNKIYEGELSEEYKYKLKPVDDDNQNFKAVMENDVKNADSDSNIIKNFKFIEDFIISKANDKDKIQSFFKGINQLVIVEITLEPNLDDPQEIFESINSTGLELSQSDLIRNFLLMSVANQKQLFNDYWKPILKNVGKDKIEKFFIDFLTMKTNKTIANTMVYRLFKNFVMDNGISKVDIFKDLKKYSEIYEIFVKRTEKYSAKLNDLMNAYRNIDQSTINPFLLHVFNDFSSGVVSEEVIIKILILNLNYIIKRYICGISTNSLRSLYATLYIRVFLFEENKKYYYESVATFLFSLKTKDAFPSSELFDSMFIEYPIYQNEKLTKFILDLIENENYKENIDTENLTIEHIMPQTLEKNWKEMLGSEYFEIHEKYLHTIGNLTLTGYNSDLSNKPFNEKVKMLKENSKVKTLNSDVIDSDVWNQSKIVSRARRLLSKFNILLGIKPFDSINVKFENTFEFNLEDEELLSQVSHSKLLGWQFEGKKYDDSKYIFMFINFIKLMYNKDASLMERISSKKLNPYENGKKAYISDNSNGMHSFTIISDKVFIEENIDAKGIVSLIRKILIEYSYNLNEFKFKVKQV